MFVLPFVDLPAARRLKQCSSRQTRLAFYRRGIIGTWFTVIVIVVCSGYRRLFVVPRHPGDLPWLDGQPWIYAIAAASTTAYFALGLWPGLHALLNPGMRLKYTKAMRPFRFLMPVSKEERYEWVLVSVTAGIGEELLFRGFLLQYLHGGLDGGPHLSLTTAWLLSSAAFGVAHIYQGWAGMLRTILPGLVFGLLVILTGGLGLSILLHSLCDLQILTMYRPAIDAPEDAAELAVGCNCE